ncbi:MAG TPA: hypothetical protein VMT63_13865 [Bacteroidales bacterium]|nr:hypothetical protein [Bacteroidales bacterium]
MKKLSFIYIFVIFLILILGQETTFSQEKKAQNQVNKYLITLVDGTTMQGVISSETDTEITLIADNIGTVSIKKNQIKSKVLLSSENLKNGKYWFPNPNYSRYFISPGIQLKKGDGYYQNVDLAANTVSYGITDWLSMGGGIELYSTLHGQPIFMLIPKVGFEVGKSFWLGGGVLYINSTKSLGDFGGLGLGYFTATYGNTNNNLTAGIGWGYLDGDWAKKPIVTISGMTRVSRRIGLVTENWIFPEHADYSIFTYGVRFMGEKIAVDLALVNNKEIAKQFPIGFPIYVDFVIKF